MASSGFKTEKRRAASAAWAALAGIALAVFTAVPVALAAPKSLLVVDVNTGAVLIDQDGEEPRAPASLTKMMTLYLAFEAIERGSATLRTPIRISARAANAAPSKLDLDVGDTIALEDAIRALVTKSANDVAVAIAEHFAGTEDAFARAMTSKAAELGMNATTFKNASGLPDSGQMTTARDMVTLALRLYDTFPRHFGVFATRAFAYEGKTYKNHNTLMVQMPGINGIKTGYTHASGFNLVTSYEHDGRHLMAAIFGGDSAGSRNATMRVALLRSISKASPEKTRKPLIIASSRARPPLQRPASRPAGETTTGEQLASNANRAPPQPAPVARNYVPAPVAVPTPVAVARPPVPDRPTYSGQPAGIAAVTQTPAGRSAAVAEGQMVPVVGHNVQMARVRPVDVTPSVAPSTAPAPAPVPAPASAPAFAAPPLASGVAPSAADGRAPMGAPARPSPETGSPLASTPTVSDVRLPAAPQRAGSEPAPGRQPGRPPSSLERQHAMLTGGGTQPPAATAAPPTYRLAGPVVGVPRTAEPSPVVATRPGPMEIQLGAFATPEEADRLIASAQSRAGAALAGRPPARRPVTVNGRTLQRARFTGFDQQSATATCAELERLRFACIVMRAE